MKHLMLECETIEGEPIDCSKLLKQFEEQELSVKALKLAAEYIADITEECPYDEVCNVGDNCDEPSDCWIEYFMKKAAQVRK